MDLRRPARIHLGFLAVATTLLVRPPLASAQDDLDDLLDTRTESEQSDERPSPVKESGRPASDSPEDSPQAAGESEPAPAPEPQPPAPRARAIEEIVVTAQKKEQALQDVPISMTVLDGDFISESGSENLHELVEFAPNVRFNRNDATSRVFIRGFGTPQSATPFEPAVGLVLDELPMGNTMFMSDPIYDIERFEVLRGPQGILFGKNTTAGLFNIITRRPTPEMTADFKGRIGGLGIQRLETAIGGPIPGLDIAQFRLAALHSQQAGDVHNTKLNRDMPKTRQRAGRLQLAVQPLDRLEVRMIGELANTELNGPAFGAVQNHDLRPSTLDFLRQFDPEVEDDGFDHQNSMDLSIPTTRDSHRLQVNARYGLPDVASIRDLELATVVGLSSFDLFGTFEFDFSPADILPARDFTDYSQRSAEVRLSGLLPAPFRFGEVEFLTGFLFFDSDWTSDFPIFAGEHFDEFLLSAAAFELVTGEQPPGGVGFEDLNAAATALGVEAPSNPDAIEGDGVRAFLDQNLRSTGLFGQLDWHVTHQWTVKAGARLTIEKKDGFYMTECFEPGIVCPALGAEEFERVLDRRETNVSPEVGLQYRPFDNLSLFAKRAQGFKSGGFNHLALTPAGVEVDEETAVSWEVGAKGTLLGGALAYGATLFHMVGDDLQLQANEGAAVITKNAASARSQGLELEFQWLTPWELLSVRGAGALTDAEFTDFPDAPTPASSDEEVQDLSGKRLPWVPKRQLSLSPELRIPFPARALPFIGEWMPQTLVLKTAFDLLYRSSFFLAPDLGPRKLQDGYTKLDGRVALTTENETLSFGASVKNITDVDVWELAQDSLTFPAGLFVRQEFQRNYSFGLTYRW